MPNIALPPSPPVAVVDIGSNSVRLVVYDNNERAPLPVFNEKVLCGLGRDLDQTGALPEEGVARALRTLVRFVSLARSMDVSRIDILATAAVREASNGPEFVAEAEALCGQKISVLSGEEEARYAAYGLLSGTPGANGILGDLGGGSVELVDVSAGTTGAYVTLPLGPVRFDERELQSPVKAVKRVDEILANVDFLDSGKDRPFYAVGGAWRSIARLHMEQTGYPLHIIHNYQMPYDQALEFSHFVSNLSSQTLSKTPGISKRRLDTLPFAGMLMHRLLLRTRPSEVIMSAYGLREGSLYSHLRPDVQAKDPLLESCRLFVLRRHKAAVGGDQLFDWISPAFEASDPAESRLRHAACMLSDVARLEHPDYRADHSLMRVLRFPFVGVQHKDRAFMSMAVASRHARLNEKSDTAKAITFLLSDEEKRRARAIGLAMRLAFSVSGGIATILERFRLSLEDENLVLEFDAEAGNSIFGDVVERRLGTFAKSLNRAPMIRRL